MSGPRAIYVREFYHNGTHVTEWKLSHAFAVDRTSTTSTLVPVTKEWHLTMFTWHSRERSAYMAAPGVSMPAVLWVSDEELEHLETSHKDDGVMERLGYRPTFL